MAPRNGRDGIELEASDGPRDVEQILRARAGGSRAGEALLRDREATRHAG